MLRGRGRSCYLYRMSRPAWRQELARSITTSDGLPPFICLSPSERAFLRTGGEGRLPLKVPPAMVRRMVRAAEAAGGALPADDPLRRQSLPREEELAAQPYELADPLGEQKHSPLPRLVHRYPDRALLLVTDQCALHCRHCFRSRFTGGGRGAITAAELADVAAYLRVQQEIRELILSGGDALLLSDRQLSDALSAARAARPGITFRVATRAPVVLPSRVTPELVRLLRAHAPVWIVTQVNHPHELDAESASALALLIDAGLPVINQTVLLAGVNDDADTLERLFRGLVERRVKPYYLFQGDLAPGTSHFRVNLERALSIVAELRPRLSGLAMPVFAVDIPGGAGKVPLEPSALVGEDEAGYRLAGPDGSIHHYPRERV